MSSQRNLLIFFLAVVVLIGLGIWFGMQLGNASTSGPSPYSAVYLTTGDVYFGKLSWLPWPHLSDVWFLQRNPDQSPGQPALLLNRFSTTQWGTVDTMYLNPRQIMLWTTLRNDSPLLKVITSPQQPTQQPPPSLPAPSATSSSSKRE